MKELLEKNVFSHINLSDKEYFQRLEVTLKEKNLKDLKFFISQTLLVITFISLKVESFDTIK